MKIKYLWSTHFGLSNKVFVKIRECYVVISCLAKKPALHAFPLFVQRALRAPCAYGPWVLVSPKLIVVTALVTWIEPGGPYAPILLATET